MRKILTEAIGRRLKAAAVLLFAIVFAWVLIPAGAYAGWERQNPVPQENVLKGAYGSGPNDVFAVGYATGGGGGGGYCFSSDGYSGAILHYNGSTWMSMLSGTPHGFTDIWGSAANDVFAVGTHGSILHYNGTVWTAMKSDTTDDLYGVWGSGANDVFAVGNSVLSDRNTCVTISTSTTIQHYDGTAWATMYSSTNGDKFVDVWGSSANDVFAVGTQGTILHYNGTAWMPSGTTDKILNGIWGSGPNDVFAVGAGGTILHYDGTSWTEVASGITDRWLYGIWGSGPNDVFAVGAGGAILHYDGTTWTEAALGITDRWLYGVWGSGTNDVFAVGNEGTILHLNSTIKKDVAESGGDGGACFIATAAWGSYLDPHVQVLRDFRDHCLLTNRLGRAFVAFYYTHSPPIAAYIRQNESVRTVTRLMLTPIVYGVGYPWLVLLFGGIVVCIWLMNMKLRFPAFAEMNRKQKPSA